MSSDDEVFELDADLDLANQKIRQLRARIKELVDERKAARTPGVATLGTPVGEIEGKPVLVGGVQGRTRTPDVSRLLAAVLDDLAYLDEAGLLDRGQRDRMEKLRVVIAAAAHEAAQSGRPAQKGAGG